MLKLGVTRFVNYGFCDLGTSHLVNLGGVLNFLEDFFLSGFFLEDIESLELSFFILLYGY